MSIFEFQWSKWAPSKGPRRSTCLYTRLFTSQGSGQTCKSRWAHLRERSVSVAEVVVGFYWRNIGCSAKFLKSERGTTILWEKRLASFPLSVIFIFSLSHRDRTLCLASRWGDLPALLRVHEDAIAGHLPRDGLGGLPRLALVHQDHLRLHQGTCTQEALISTCFLFLVNVSCFL